MSRTPPWAANALLVGLLLALCGPRAFATAADAPKNEAAVEKNGPATSPEAKVLGDPNNPEPPAEGSFTADPYESKAEEAAYGAKHLNATAQPPIQLGIRLYDRGAYAPRPTLFGEKNPSQFHFMAYGDVRVAAADNDSGVAGAHGRTDQSRIATRLNLDLDLALTATERIHAFMRPFDNTTRFTRYEIAGGANNKFVQEFNTRIDTLFFEGDVGSMLSGFSGKSSSFELPFSVGLVPITTQKGIWIEDAFEGMAVGMTAMSSRVLDISNMDLTFFTGLHRVTTDAVAGHGTAKLFGLAGFADLLGGYMEAGYGYVDAEDGALSYHNVTAAFTEQYLDLVSNSVRLIGNFGQRAATKTANGLLVLVENSLLTSRPLTLVPYLNLFAGFDSPQSLARAVDSGGVLRNTGINFQTDGLTGFPTLDARGHDSYGGAMGVEYLFNLDRQVVVEGAAVEPMRSNPLGAEYALGASFQQPLSNAWIWRLDGMRGWLERQRDIFGVRMELRRKF